MRRVGLVLVLLYLGLGTKVLAASTFSQAKIYVQNGQTVLDMQFLLGVPAYQIRALDERRIQLHLSGVTASPTLSLPASGGLISAVDSKSAGPDLDVTMTLQRRAELTVQRNPGSLLLVFSPSASFAAPMPSSSSASQESGGSVGAAETVFLKYANVDEVAALFGAGDYGTSNGLSDVATIQPMQPNAAGSYQSPALNLPRVESNTRSAIARKVSDGVYVDSRLGAVILTGTPDQIAANRAVIEAIDAPDRPQKSVILETQIVELTDSAARHIGINYSPNGGVAVGTVSSRSFNAPDSGVEFQAQLYAEISSGQGRLVATPRVQALDGTRASILTGDALPILTTITYPGSPPTIQQQIQYVNVGVQLQIDARISASGIVTSNIYAAVSNVTGYVEGNVPRISQRQATAIAQVRDAQPYVIGGLLQDNEITNVSRVPILGDLPILGSLFKLRNTTHEKTNLYIIVTPHVLQTPKPDR